jgi:hypothetical protein
MSRRILCGLQSRQLRCGCLVGVYETYAGGRVEIIDARGLGCTDRTHRQGFTIKPRQDSVHQTGADVQPCGS